MTSDNNPFVINGTLNGGMELDSHSSEQERTGEPNNSDFASEYNRSGSRVGKRLRVVIFNRLWYGIQYRQSRINIHENKINK